MTRTVGPVCLAAAVLALSVGCAGSASRPAELTGTIAFIGRGGHVFTVDAADSVVKRIGRRDAAGGPSWSPEGATIAYSTPSGDIMVANTSGADETPLTPPWCFGPVFSPDGSQLVCDVTEPNVITVVDATDGRRVMETADCCYQPAWSPDGRQIAFVSYGTWSKKGYVGPQGLFVMNADGTNKRLVAEGVDYSETPAWSSRGVIAFIGDGGVWAVDLSGTAPRRLVAADGRDTRALAWSPDGGRLAFQHGDGDYEVFVVNADGSGLENVTDNEKIHDEVPSWSPDGKAIVFVSDRDEGLDQIYAMRADGSGQTQLTHDADWSASYPSWNPAS